MGFVDPQLEILVVEFVIAYAQGVARLARVDGIRAIGEGVTHIFQRSRRGEEFRFKHDVLVLMTGQIRRSSVGGQGVIPCFKGGNYSAAQRTGKAPSSVGPASGAPPGVNVRPIDLRPLPSGIRRRTPPG